MTEPIRKPYDDIVVDGKVMDRLNTTGVKGWVPVIDLEGPFQQPVLKLTPWFRDPIVRFRDTGEIGWNPSYEPGKAFPAPPEVTQAIESRKAPEVKTSAKQKYEALVKLLTHEARKFTHDGVTTWPLSVQTELKEAAWKMGKAGTLTTEEQVELLARTFIVHSANKQKEHDRKHTASVHPSRGHYAA